MGKGGNSVIGMSLLVIALFALVSSILLPIAIPFVRTSGTNIKAIVSDATVNSTIDSFIGLLNYVSLFWYIGVVLSLIAGAIGGVILAVTSIGKR